MVKGRALPSVMDTSSSSDDTYNSNMGKVKKNINTFVPTTENLNLEKIHKKRSKMELSQDINDNDNTLESFLKRKCNEDERSSDSETEYSNLQRVEQIMENAPSKLSKKLKKKRKSDICSDDSTGEENINNEYLKSLDKNSFDNSKMNQKRKAFVTPDLLQKGKSVTKGVNISPVKKEVLSDDAESSSAESDSNCNNDSEINQKNIVTVIKSEVHSNTSSDCEDEDDNISSAHEPEAKYSIVETPVTILQDIRLTPKSKSAKEKLKEKYPGLKPIEIMTELNLSDFDEIHLFRIPKNVDPQSLRHAEINLEKECKVNLSEKYVITSTTKVPDPTLVISANTSVLCFKNNIKMEKYIKSKVEPNIEVPEKKSVPLPENLKKRHPLFGPDFKQKIKLSEHVERKLDEAIANLLKRERKSKKKKDKKNKQNVKEEKPNGEIIDIFSSNSFLTDRMKKETSDDSAFGSSSSTDNPRGKKKDKGHSSDMSIEQEMKCSIEKESREKRKEKTKKEKSSDHDCIDTAEIKKEQDFDTVGTEEVSTSPKKKKKSSIINSTLMSDILKTPQFNSEVSTIIAEDSSGKKSRKSKKDRMSNEGGNIKKEELISELLNNVTKELDVSGKIKTEF
ncbi:muscle M-line assembly protein unc-89-like [Anoplophora glabripennis]|uniref:muscle M-line assembly protein unc-89-like n=1 Tax=Anoplophora glabripennis TaxID=217634 RepID=UPI0008749F62|nr:muscle M-line assembly protein unc-89-like [Anoplophora glabripennis]